VLASDDYTESMSLDNALCESHMNYVSSSSEEQNQKLRHSCREGGASTLTANISANSSKQTRGSAQAVTDSSITK